MSKGRTIAIGDIHGCDIALERLLDAVKPMPDDTVIQLGDICDRGPATKRVFELLIGLSRRCNFKMIMGNHDELMLGVFGRHAACDLGFWWGVGGAETIESYGGDPDRVPDEHLDFLEAALPYLETETEILIHATLCDGIPLQDQNADWLRWHKVSGKEAPHPSGKRIVCGHTSQRSGKPLVWKGWACIDTRVYDEGGWLTALDLDSNEILQANQEGAVRGPFPL